MISNSKASPLETTEPTIPQLPESVTTRGGAVFYPQEQRWNYRDAPSGVAINFELMPAFTAELIQWIKLTMCVIAKTTSPSNVMNISNSLVLLSKHLVENGLSPISMVSGPVLFGFRGKCRNQSFYTLLRFVRKCHEHGHVCVTPEAAAYAEQVVERQEPRATAVRTMDPTKGPFSDLELQGIQAALNNAYADGSISLARYLEVWLFMLLGVRPAQLVLLKLKDYSVEGTDQGDRLYYLNVPRVKQGQPARSQFKKRQIIPQLGYLLSLYVAAVRERFDGDTVLDGLDNAPLFPMTRNISTVWAPGLEYHQSSISFSAMLTQVFGRISVVSERTGEALRITARRFRYTFGTRAAEEGFAPLVIADLLDHSDLSNVMVYIESRAKSAERLNEKIGNAMVPLAQAFTGTLIVDESKARRGNDPASRIIDLRVERSGQGMGSCGHYGYCGFSAPVACYTCRNFEPWLDGPHKAVLSDLLKRKQDQASTDHRIASIHDRTIAAVREVIALCHQAQMLRQKGEN